MKKLCPCCHSSGWLSYEVVCTVCTEPYPTSEAVFCICRADSAPNFPTWRTLYTQSKVQTPYPCGNPYCRGRYEVDQSLHNPEECLSYYIENYYSERRGKQWEGMQR